MIVPQNKVTVAPSIPNIDQYYHQLNFNIYLHSICSHHFCLSMPAHVQPILEDYIELDQLRLRIYIITMMMFNLRMLALFSRGKTVLRSAKRKNTPESRVSFLNPYGIDMENFDYLQGLQDINIRSEDQELVWINDLKNRYEENDESSSIKLRERQEKMIRQIDLISGIEYKLPSLYGLKMSFNVKFRKWEDILVDSENAIKLVKDPDYENQSEAQLLKLYNVKCIACIMSNHDRLYESLKFKNTKLAKRVKRGKVEKTEEKDVGLFFYTSAEERIELIQSTQQTYHQYFETVRLQSIGLLALGQRENALKRLSKMTGNNLSAEAKEEVFILMLVGLSYQTNVKHSVSEKLKNKLGKISQITESQAIQLSKCSISASQSEELLNQISLSVNKKPLSELSNIGLRKYGRILCLIAENYYLEGKKQDSLRLFQFLSKLEQFKQIKMIMIFIKMGISFDSGNYQQILSLFEQYKKQQVDQSTEKANKSFYDVNLVNNDLVRINIYKLVVKVYKQLKKPQIQEEIQDECDAMETTLLAYTLKEPTFTKEQQEEDLMMNWRFKTQIRIPYYYFDLKLQRYFTPNWELDYSIA